MKRLDQDTASSFARLTLGHLTRQWPYVLGQVLNGPGDLATPEELHPVFHGSLDWHSCVHGWWQVMRLARLYPAMPDVAAIEALADKMFVSHKVERECDYFERPMSGGFERPYGWGWLLALHLELGLRPERPWAATLAPLAHLLAGRFVEYLPKLPYPVRSGKHDSTAFALIHALEWARVHDESLAALIESRARQWFGHDRDARPWEPSGEDFLSATLCEAVLMQEVLGEREFPAWFDLFLADPFGPSLSCLHVPAMVTDRSDGRLAHLDGLNLSRAWCWRRLAGSTRNPAAALTIAEHHLADALPNLAVDYMGEHWLATFALLALETTN
ncbi:DUF2891 domain-containing protein [Sphingobium sp. H39-3-25]|uniref:DUF2891 domain-containing protein n=1 Tax=Sphingobium arseniciresistens TaxID=3030834 RepID=UPI0023B9BDA7|nr:DUF2891 domain-containing protein [Sphingobium arseniciresistens]